MANPPIPDPQSAWGSGLYRFAVAVKKALDVGLGRIGNASDKWVTRGELADAGLIAAASTTSTSSSVSVGNHNSLGGLNSGDYQHLSAAEDAALTGSGNTTLHYHSADRARSNHTGTQDWTTITGADDAITVPDLIDTGESLTVSANRQLIVYNRLTVSGTLTVNGTLRVL